MFKNQQMSPRVSYKSRKKKRYINKCKDELFRFFSPLVRDLICVICNGFLIVFVPNYLIGYP